MFSLVAAAGGDLGRFAAPTQVGASSPVGSENPQLFALNVNVQSEGFLNRSKEASTFLVEVLASFRFSRPIELAKCLH